MQCPAYLCNPAKSPFQKSASPGFGDALSECCQNEWYDHPAGNVPTLLEYLATHKGFVLPNAALLPVHVVHQSVVV